MPKRKAPSSERENKRTRLETETQAMIDGLQRRTQSDIEEDSVENPKYKARLEKLTRETVVPCLQSATALLHGLPTNFDCVNNFINGTYELWSTPVSEGGWKQPGQPPNIPMENVRTLYDLMMTFFISPEHPGDPDPFAHKSVHYLLLQNIVENMDTYSPEKKHFLAELVWLMEQEGMTGVYAVPPKRSVGNVLDRATHDTIHRWLGEREEGEEGPALGPCPFGTKCYRQMNPKHLREFSHPGHPDQATNRSRSHKYWDHGTSGTGVAINNTLVKSMLESALPAKGGKKHRMRSRRKSNRKSNKRTKKRTGKRTTRKTRK